MVTGVICDPSESQATAAPDQRRGQGRVVALQAPQSAAQKAESVTLSGGTSGGLDRRPSDAM